MDGTGATGPMFRKVPAMTTEELTQDIYRLSSQGLLLERELAKAKAKALKQDERLKINDLMIFLSLVLSLVTFVLEVTR